MNCWIAARMARELMDAHGLDSWGFRFNHRKCDMGCCHFHHERIELSMHFVRDNDTELVRDTILHEIAHALAGHAAGHGPKWKKMCREVGATPTRCGEAKMPAGQWQAVCPGCGWTYTRHRRPAQHAGYHCTGCGPKRGALRFEHASQVSQAARLQFK